MWFSLHLKMKQSLTSKCNAENFLNAARQKFPIPEQCPCLWNLLLTVLRDTAVIFEKMPFTLLAWVIYDLRK